MLCRSSVARAAMTISAVNKIKKDKFIIRRINSFLWCGISNKLECSAICYGLLTCFLV